MMVFYFVVFAFVTAGVRAGYAEGSENDLGYGSGDSYGYSGSFAGSGPPPSFAIPAFDFSGFLGNYLGTLHFLCRGGGAFSYSYASSSPTASASAQSSLTFKSNNRLQSNIEAASRGYGNPGGFSGGGYGGSYGGGYGGGGNGGAFGGSFSGPSTYSYSSPNIGPRIYPESINFASRGSFGVPNGGAATATASAGSDGIRQSASVYPENPNSPNVNTRFATAAPPGPGGFRSVFTASESRTVNVGGKPVTVQKASTTVNDNGKIITYTAKSP
ncbi:hypothetical protein NQ315_010405 [Exocentrus adspersus]|uniref:Uncharacterized protein n=1 Tax=Exocentrus adspersus TaxID=1586481 RepID=A0AAV8WC00_9CUCU|nr:hypothetical protein NQ315_010405 [Exocentrus adspersus]